MLQTALQCRCRCRSYLLRNSLQSPALPSIPQSFPKQKRRRARQCSQISAHKVSIEYDGGTAELEVPEGSTILETALEQGLELKHDCKMGVCMTCPGKVISGDVDQSAGMLDEGAREKGYALLCVAEPLSDCKVATISEEEILDEVLCA